MSAHEVSIAIPPLPTPEECERNTPPPRKASWRRIVGLLAIALLGAVFGGGVARATQGGIGQLKPDDLPLWAFVVGGLLSFPLVLLVHELGHVLGGQFAGFRFLLLVVGPLKVIREGTRLRLRWNTNASIAGGLAASTPIGPGDHRWGLVAMIAGGPAASLLSAGLGLVVARSAAVGGWGVLPWSISLWFSLFSLFIGIVTLIPAQTSGFKTDGARLVGLLRGGPETNRELALSTLVAASASGVRPREFDRDTVNRAASIRDGGLFEATSQMIAASAARDRGELASARDHLAAALLLSHRVPASIRPVYGLEAATFEATVRRDPVAGRRWLDAAGDGSLVPRHYKPLAEAAVRVAEGRAAEAIPFIDAARKALAASTDPGSRIVDGESLDSLEREARSTVVA